MRFVYMGVASDDTTQEAISKYLQNALASFFWRGVRHSGSKRRGFGDEVR